MLVVITTSQKLDCLRKLGSVFCNHQNLPMEFVQSIAEALRLINAGGVKAVFSLGSGPLEEIQAAGYVPKNRKVAGLRKQVMSLAGVPLMISYSPNIGEVDYSQFVDLLTDTNLACVLASTGSISPKYGDYKYVPTLAPIVQGVKALLEDPEVKKVPLAFDTETLGLDRFHPGGYLISLQFSFKVGTAYMVAWSSRAESLAWLQGFQNQQDLHWLMNEPRIALRAANGKYDLEWLYEHSGITCTNFTADTTLIGSLLDENRSNGLDVHAKIYAPRLAGYSDDFDSKTDKSRMDLAYARDPQKFLNYSAGDADATLEVSINQIQQLTAVPHLARFYVDILHPAARAYEIVERGGVFIDMEEFNRLEADLIADLHSLTDKGKKIIGGSLVAKHFDADKTGGLNLTKASLITDFMFSPRGLNLKPKMLTEKTKAPVTSLEHLEMFKDVPEAKEFVGLMSEFSSTNKTLSTYINGFRQHIRSDGKFHPSYWLHAGNRDSGEGGTNCMPARELVLTDRGYLPVEDVKVGHTVLTHQGRPRRVTHIVVNGVKPIVEVTLANGLSLRTTENHAYLIGESWVEAKDLAVGMMAWTHSEREQWSVIPDWDEFEVSTWGRVRRLSTGKIQTQYRKGKWGHLKVVLTRNGVQSRGPDKKDVPVHRLVAETFGTPGVGPEVRHLNGLAWDNTLGNLQKGTSKKNKADAIAHGTMTRRYGNQAVLSDETAEIIRSTPRATRSGGVTNSELASRFGVCERLVRAVRNGDRWQPKEVGEKRAAFSTSAIVAVTFLPPDQTYGLTVDEDESHVTGGIVTHNTGRLSATDPAFQCLKGDSQVTTSQGLQSIADIVDGYSNGREFRVLTHTGKWKPVVGVYKNGVRPVFDVRFGTGKIVTSTENHPYLTARGWVRTDQLKPGDICYELRAPNPEVHQSDLSQLGGNEEPLHQPNQQGLASVRGQRDSSLRQVEAVRELSCGYGGKAQEGDVHRAGGREWQLRAGELHLGNSEEAGSESHELQADHAQRADEDRSRVGIRSGDQSGTVALSTLCGDVDGASLDEGQPWDRSIFQEVEVISITPAGECETFDLTIQDSHSFVANGVVVHNTIPKHTKWGKRIRRCYNAPPGMLVAEEDYSQGELKVMACIANEQVMIEAYQKGLDLHVVTSSFVAGLTYDEMMELKKTNKDQYDDIRQLGKAGNFGLIYGMGVEGFIDYARTSYGVIMSYEKAAEFHAGFFTRYPGLPNYHKQYKEFAHRKGYVVSPLGRVRHLPMINAKRSDIRSREERRAVNSPVQSTLSDMMLWAIAIQHDLGWFDESPCFGSIHDAGYFYIPEDNYEFYARRSTEVMENLPFHKIGWEPQLKFTADAKVGPNMGQLTELKFT